MKLLHLALVLVLASLTACAKQDESQYVIQSPDLTAARQSQMTVEVLEVSLPRYAQDQEIPVADADGVIRTDGNALWADAPTRAVSLGLAEALSKLTGAVTAVEPWPLDEPADATLDIRVKTLLASAGDGLRFSGQYFVVYEADRQPRTAWFDIRVPIAGLSAGDVSRATGAAVTELAKTIAANLR